jgi:hypothetical protein
MMKKAVSILFLCLFFLFGMQCLASNKKEISFAKTELKNSDASDTFQKVSKQENNATFSSIEKLHKKKRFSRTHHNAIASLSKCNGHCINLGTLSTSGYQFSGGSNLRQDFSNYTFHNSFCHRKLLSIFYSFQAFW